MIRFARESAGNRIMKHRPVPHEVMSTLMLDPYVPNSHSSDLDVMLLQRPVSTTQSIQEYPLVARDIGSCEASSAEESELKRARAPGHAMGKVRRTRNSCTSVINI